MFVKEVNFIEIDVLYEVGGGGEVGGVIVVDYVLWLMVEVGGLQIEDIEDCQYGGFYVLVLNFDRGRLIKEFFGGCLLLFLWMGGDYYYRGVMELNVGFYGFFMRFDMWDYFQGGLFFLGGFMFLGGGGFFMFL